MPRFNEFTTQYLTYLRNGGGGGEYAFGIKGVTDGEEYGFNLPKNASPKQIYQIMVEKTSRLYRGFKSKKLGRDYGIRNIETSTIDQMKIEADWYAIGRPHYKVWPSMVDALLDTKIDIPSAQIQTPFPVIEIRLPSRHLREDEDAPYLRAMMVKRGVDYAGKECLVVFSQFEVDGWCRENGANEMSNSIVSKFTLNEGHTVNEDLDVMPFKQSRHSESGVYWPDRAMTRRLVALAIGVCFIAIGKDKKLIKPAKRDVMDRVKRKGSILPGKGWAVGSDILLPRRSQAKGREGFVDSQTGLVYGHARSGHMRYQKYGPKDDPRHKLIFIFPTVVRPDLPLKPRLTPRAITGQGGQGA